MSVHKLHFLRSMIVSSYQSNCLLQDHNKKKERNLVNCSEIVDHNFGHKFALEPLILVVKFCKRRLPNVIGWEHFCSWRQLQWLAVNRSSSDRMHRFSLEKLLHFFADSTLLVISLIRLDLVCGSDAEKHTTNICLQPPVARVKQWKISVKHWVPRHTGFSVRDLNSMFNPRVLWLFQCNTNEYKLTFFAQRQLWIAGTWKKNNRPYIALYGVRGSIPRNSANPRNWR